MNEGDGGLMSGINVTPLCDIFVVLLIILMLAHDSANQQGPAIDLPQRTPVPRVLPEHSCTITVTQDTGCVWVAGGEQAFKVTLEALPARLQDILKGAAGRQVMVRAHPEVNLDRVVQVMGIAHANGAGPIGLGTLIRP